jgi:hypothetical protein
VTVPSTTAASPLPGTGSSLTVTGAELAILTVTEMSVLEEARVAASEARPPTTETPTNVSVLASVAAAVPALASFFSGDSAAFLAGAMVVVRDTTAVVVIDDNHADALIDQLSDARHALAGTLELTPATTRIVVRAEQAAYRAQWRACTTANDHDDASDAHPYTAHHHHGTVALTTPAGSWLVHRDDLAVRAHLLW